MKMIVKIKGKVFDFWTSANIKRSVDEFCHTFSLETSSEAELTDFSFSINDKVEILLESGDPVSRDLIITGYIDTVSYAVEASQNSIRIEGRSVNADFEDSHITDIIPAGTLFSQLSYVASKFGLKVVDNLGANMTSAELDMTAENPFDIFRTLIRDIDGILLIDGNGNLEITKVSTTQLPATLEIGKNILSAKMSRTINGQYSKISVSGGANNNAEVFDKSILRYRPMEFFADAGGENISSENQAKIKLAEQKQKSFGLDVVVQGAEYKTGSHWFENRRVKVKVFDIDEVMYIRAVVFTSSTAGTTTTIQLSKI